MIWWSSYSPRSAVLVGSRDVSKLPHSLSDRHRQNGRLLDRRAPTPLCLQGETCQLITTPECSGYDFCRAFRCSARSPISLLIWVVAGSGIHSSKRGEQRACPHQSRECLHGAVYLVEMGIGTSLLTTRPWRPDPSPQFSGQLMSAVEEASDRLFWKVL